MNPEIITVQPISITPAIKGGELTLAHQQTASLALAEVKPELVTPELCQWALTRAMEGCDALTLRQEALEIQQIALGQKVEKLTECVASQNALLRGIGENQLALQQSQDQLFREVQALKSRPAETFSSQPPVINAKNVTIHDYRSNVDIHDNKGIVSVDTSSGKTSWWVAAALLLLILAFLSVVSVEVVKPEQPTKATTTTTGK
jgi:hypothetical protein